MVHEDDAQVLASYLNGKQLDDVLEGAAYENSQNPTQENLDTIDTVKRAIEILA